MIRLGLHLTLRGGREALVRLIGIAVAVTIGTAMLLTVLAGVNAVNNQNARYAWLATGSAIDRNPPQAPELDPLWGHLTDDIFRGSTIVRADVAATGPKSPVIPGLSRLPGPGEYYASPALARLIALGPARRAGRSLSRPAGRHDRRCGPAVTRLPDCGRGQDGRTGSCDSRRC